MTIQKSFKSFVISAAMMLLLCSIITAEQKQLTIGSIDLVYCPAGELVRHSHNDTIHNTKHKLIETKHIQSFYIGKYEITQKQYFDITGKNPCDEYRSTCHSSHPVRYIDWYDAVEFCNLLSIKNNLHPYYTIQKNKKDPLNIFPYDEKKWIVTANPQANGFRLPREEQWEYAYRAGSTAKYYWGNSTHPAIINQYAVHFFNSGLNRIEKGQLWNTKYHKVLPVGSKKPNLWGLYDMAGNTAEWCQNTFTAGAYQARVLKGGHFRNDVTRMSAEYREAGVPSDSRDFYGLRVVLPADVKK